MLLRLPTVAVPPVASFRGSSCSACASGKVGADPDWEAVVAVDLGGYRSGAETVRQMRFADRHLEPVSKLIAGAAAEQTILPRRLGLWRGGSTGVG